ncbi:MAG: 1,4-dihydroxy-2-naphthoate polyprenyltransferase, partial [Peptococcaceae bacterium]|nr:1,4-dihydroxy-2-naphthoate polyprenyltransferase [Peptococcaceae bacterium]
MKSFDYYWKMTRPHTLAASMIPVLTGISFAIYAEGAFRFLLAVAMFLCAVLIQIATNLFNEYYDFKNGLDDQSSVGIGGAIVHEGVSPRAVMTAALVIYGICGLLGIYLALSTSLVLLVIGAICLLIGYLYTGGPLPISRTPLGELFAGTLMGTGYCMIAYYTQTGHVTFSSFVISVPLNILIALLLTANSLRDRIKDAANGRRTLAILLGPERTVLFMVFGFTLAYVWLFVLLFNGHNALILLPLLSVIYPINCINV